MTKLSDEKKTNHKTVLLRKQKTILNDNDKPVVHTCDSYCQVVPALSSTLLFKKQFNEKKSHVSINKDRKTL